MDKLIGLVATNLALKGKTLVPLRRSVRRVTERPRITVYAPSFRGSFQAPRSPVPARRCWRGAYNKVSPYLSTGVLRSRETESKRKGQQGEALYNNVPKINGIHVSVSYPNGELLPRFYWLARVADNNSGWLFSREEEFHGRVGSFVEIGRHWLQIERPDQWWVFVPQNHVTVNLLNTCLRCFADYTDAFA